MSNQNYTQGEVDDIHKKWLNALRTAKEKLREYHRTKAIPQSLSANNKKWIEKIERLLIIFKPQTFCPYTLSAVSYSIECTDCHTRDVELEHCFIHAWQQLKKDMEVSQ